ncbi:MAG: GyrI-like domain-containing protein [Ignavibacteriales bacterium]|nr:GyrI-like domain-containing protein [Ignavibacteriales bacterium]
MKYGIGEFSRITSLSIKSLRLYHEKEILVPSEVDQFTGYRYYNEMNIEFAKTIKILKEYDFSLAEIKEIIDEFNDESEILEQLIKKKNEIEKKIARYKDISVSIDSIIKKEKENKMRIENEFEIEEKEIETMLIAAYRMKGKYSDVGKGFGVLAKNFGSEINGKAMCLYYDGEYKEDDADIETCFPVRKGKDVDGISVRGLKGGRCVSLMHKGPYELLGESYRKIFNYINARNYNTLIPSREVYIKGPGMIFKGNPNNYLTEIQIFIQR